MIAQAFAIRRRVSLLKLFGVLILAASVAAGETIYSESFTGAGALNGTAPDVRPGSETWTANANFNKDGSLTASGGDESAFLPFVPQSGKIYTLSVTMTQPSGGSWCALGFTASANTSGSFWANNAAPWILYRPDSNTDSFLGPGTGSSADEGNHATSATFDIVLNTEGAAWSVEWFINSVSARTATYGSNPTLNYIGVGRENGSDTTFSAFSLSDNMPDRPSGTIIYFR